MANPKNPLDYFVTYTTHYELHASNSWDELKKVPAQGLNLATTEREGVKTLLINSRKDAHQLIDNIRFRHCGPTVDPSVGMQSVTDVSLDITEPNGTFFVEKIQNQAVKYKVTSLTSGLVFGLKIIFVGRLEDGSEKTIEVPSILPMQMIHMASRYSQRGGEHQLKFVCSASAMSVSPLSPGNSLARAVAYTNKNVSFKARTVQEAIKMLEQQLNKNYTDVYSTELKNCADARPLRYKITLDPQIDGRLSLVTKADSFAKDEPKHLSFTPNVDIGTMIRMILTSSKEVNEMIASSSDKLTAPKQIGVKIPVLQTMYNLQANELEVHYKISLYQGGGQTYEFWYYFSGPGKNVDILDFETRFSSMELWLSATISGTEVNRNASSDVPSSHPDLYSKNIVHEDTTRKTLFISPQDRKCIPVQEGDVAVLPASNRLEGTGYLKLEADAVPAAKLAFQTMSQACGAVNPQLSFTIRGHLDILQSLMAYPDGSQPGFGIDDGTWIKVNIFNSDGTPFFYTGDYRLLTVDNSFSGGKFTQVLTVIMNDRQTQLPGAVTK